MKVNVNNKLVPVQNIPVPRTIERPDGVREVLEELAYPGHPSLRHGRGSGCGERGQGIALHVSLGRRVGARVLSIRLRTERKLTPRVTGEMASG